MASIISTKTTGGGGIAVTGDTSGIMQLASNNGTTAVTIDASQNVTLGSNTAIAPFGIYNATNPYMALGNSLYNTYLNQTVNDFHLYTNAAYPVRFGTNNTERMRIDANGNVGIGTASPTNFGSNFKMFAVQGTDYGVIQAISNSGSTTVEMMGASGIGYVGTRTNHPLVLRTNDTERARIFTNGNFGLVNNLDFVGGAATVRIHLAGGTPNSSNSGIAAAWNVHSDYRLKENVTPLSSALQTVLSIKPVTFTWVGEENGSTTAGFIAHELAEHAPYAVMGEKDAVNEDGSIKAQAADYSKVVPLLTAAIQEQQAIITDLKARIEVLEGASA